MRQCRSVVGAAFAGGSFFAVGGRFGAGVPLLGGVGTSGGAAPATASEPTTVSTNEGANVLRGWTGMTWRITRRYAPRVSTFVALLRAVNVGGTGVLPMAELVKLCEKAGFTGVKTYIQSGNVVLGSRAGATTVKATLEKALAVKLGKPVGVHVRTAAELERVLADNPFASAPPNRVIVMFLETAPPKDVLAAVKRPGGEELAVRGRELFIRYPDGQGASKLKVPFADVGTARNINTVTKLAAMALARG
jgi:uncharacterized protein (DUF1697 family)